MNTIMAQAIKLTLNFGKYRGLTPEVLFDKDPKYALEFMINKFQPNNYEQKEFVSRLKQIVSERTIPAGLGISKYAKLYGQQAINAADIEVTPIPCVIHKPIKFETAGVDDSFIGIFFDYWIRYKLSLLLGTRFEDHFASLDQNQSELYVPKLGEAYAHMIEGVATPDEVWLVAGYHPLFFNELPPECPIPQTIMASLETIEHALVAFAEKGVLLNSSCELGWTQGFADLIVDQSIIEIKYVKSIVPAHWAQLLLYAVQHPNITKVQVWDLRRGLLITQPLDRSKLDKYVSYFTSRIDDAKCITPEINGVDAPSSVITDISKISLTDDDLDELLGL
jgi:hypothetical protein